MTAPDTDHAARIYRVLDHIEANELPVGTKIHSSITLGSCPADVDRIRRYTDDLQRELQEARAELAAERARVGRIKDLLFAVNDLATAVVDLLTDEQVEGPDYPNDLDERHAELANVCRACGDLDRDLTPDEGEVTT